MNLADLPVETFFDILAELDASSLCACRQVCKTFCATIDESKILQYRLRLSMCGYEDTLRSSQNPYDQLKLFQSHIDRWYSLDWTETRIRVPHAHLYEFMTGMYCAASYTSVTAVQLPSRLRGIEAKQWTHRDYDFEIADFTFDPSQDLLILAERYRDPARPFREYSPRIHFRTLSTNEKHPRAPAEHVDIRFPSFMSFSSLVMRTSGDTVGVFLCDTHGDTEEQSILIFVNWTLGTTGTYNYLGQRPFTWCWLSSDYVALPKEDDEGRDCIALMRISSSGSVVSHSFFYLPDHFFDRASDPTQPNIGLHCDPSPGFAPPGRPFVVGSDRIMKIEWTILDRARRVTDRDVVEIYVSVASLLRLTEKPPLEAVTEDDIQRFEWNLWGPRETRMTLRGRRAPNEYQCFTFGMRTVSLTNSSKITVRTFGGQQAGWPAPSDVETEYGYGDDSNSERNTAMHWRSRDDETVCTPPNVSYSRMRAAIAESIAQFRFEKPRLDIEDARTSLPHHLAQRDIGFTLRGLYPHGVMCDDEHIILVESFPFSGSPIDTLIVYTL